jgi:hypothetical protein
MLYIMVYIPDLHGQPSMHYGGDYFLNLNIIFTMEKKTKKKKKKKLNITFWV